jgi:hypothetical protein
MRNVTNLTHIAKKTRDVISQPVALQKFDSGRLIAASLREYLFLLRTKSYSSKASEVKKRALIRPDFSLAVKFGTWKVAPTIPMASDDTQNNFYARHNLKSTFNYLGEAEKAHRCSQVFS